MFNNMKKFKWPIVGVLLGVALFIGGFYMGNLISTREGGFVTENIAIVNLDENIEYLGESRNFGAELMTGMDSRFQLTGLSDARNGLETGRFAAYIVIPAEFSAHVASINTAMPSESTFNFVISPYLEEDTRLLAFSNVMAFQDSYREQLSTLYIASILTTFHRGQDQVQFVLENDEIDLEYLLGFDPAGLITAVDLSEFRVSERTNLPEYHQGTREVMQAHNDSNREFMLLSQTELSRVLTAFNEANDQFWESTRVEDPIPLLGGWDMTDFLDLVEFFDAVDEMNANTVGLYREDLADIEETLDDIEDLLIQADERLTDSVDIVNDLGLLRTNQLTDSRELLDEIQDIEQEIADALIDHRDVQQVIDAHQAVNQRILGFVMANPGTSFTTLRNSTLANSNVLNNEINHLFTLLSTDPRDAHPGVSNLVVFLDHFNAPNNLGTQINRRNQIMVAIENNHFAGLRTGTADLTGRLSTIDTQLESFLSNLRGELDNLDEDLAEMLAYLLSIEFVEVNFEHVSQEVLEEAIYTQVGAEIDLLKDQLDELNDDQEAFINHIITSKAAGQVVLSEYVSAVFNHDPQAFINNEVLQAQGEALSTNIQTLEGIINDRYDTFTEFTGSVIERTHDANTETTTQMVGAVDGLKDGRSTRSEENQELLNNLANTLLHTRTGSLINQNLVNTMVTPLTVQGNDGSQFLTGSTSTSINWMLPTMASLLVVAVAVFTFGSMGTSTKEETE